MSLKICTRVERGGKVLHQSLGHGLQTGRLMDDQTAKKLDAGPIFSDYIKFS